jgi:hypothetical protein
LLGAVAAVALAGLVVAPGALAAVSSAGGIKYVSKKIRVDGKSRASGVAACPKHTHVLGGGELNDGGYGSIKLGQSFPEGKGSTPDDGWEVRVRNAKSKRVPVKVQAICGDTQVRYEKHRFTARANNQSPEHDLACPSNTFAYSGGVRAGSKAPIYINSTFPMSGVDGWSAYVDNHGAETPAILYALCGKKKTADVSQTFSGISPGTQSGTTTPACSGTKHAYGGGLATNAGFGGGAINSLNQIGISGTPGEEWSGLVDATSSYSLDVTIHLVCGPSLG